MEKNVLLIDEARIERNTTYGKSELALKVEKYIKRIRAQQGFKNGEFD